MERDKDFKKELKDFTFSLGAALFGVAKISAVKKDFHFSDEILKDLNYAISIGIRLSDKVLEEIVSFPTKLYYHHYRQANIALDQIAFRVSNLIQDRGYKALSVAASQIIDWERQRGHLSHKKIGYLAGLGFIGRNNLLVNPQLGARFRLVSILIDIPIETDKPLKIDCGDCRACIDVCPVGAIKENSKDFDHIKCYEKLKEFRDKRTVDQFICGICIKACRPKLCQSTITIQ